MTLTDFIKSKPKELRLGQYFYNCYLYQLYINDRLHTDTQWLYNSKNDDQFVDYITNLMNDYQWDELPEPRTLDG